MTDTRTVALQRLAVVAMVLSLLTACGSAPGIQAEKREAH
jgi:hypothetical protein